MIETAKYFISENIVTSIITLAILALLVTTFVKVVGNRRADGLRRLDTLVESFPFIVGLVPLTGLFMKLTSMHQAISSIHSSGTGDPRVVSGGLAALYLNLAIHFGLFFILLAASLVMRFFYNRNMRGAGEE